MNTTLLLYAGIIVAAGIVVGLVLYFIATNPQSSRWPGFKMIIHKRCDIYICEDIFPFANFQQNCTLKEEPSVNELSWHVEKIVFYLLFLKPLKKTMLTFYQLLLSRYYNSNSYSNSQFYSQARMLHDSGLLSEDWNLMGLVTTALNIYSRLNQEDNDQ